MPGGWTCKVLLLYTGVGIVYMDSTKLIPQHGRAQEGTNFTFSCITDSSVFSSWTIYYPDGQTRYFIINAAAINGQCTTYNVPSGVYPFCYGNVFNITLSPVENSMHGSTWKCETPDPSNRSYMFVEVPVKYVNMDINNEAAIGVFNCTENETLSFKCITSFGRPQPNITWYTGYNYDNVSNEISTKSRLLSDYAYNYTSSSVTLAVSRSCNQKWIFCSSTNLKDVPPVVSNHSKLNVQYPPLLGEIQNLSVIEMKTVNYTCPVTLGNPTETQFTWTRNKDRHVVQNETSFLIKHVLRKDKGFYSLTARNTMKLSNGTDVQGISTSMLYLEVLYPPEAFQVTCLTGSLRNESFSDTISVIEDVSLTLICSAEGNPLPSSFSWRGNVTANQANLTFNVNKNHSGDFMCTAGNTMKEIPGNITIGANNKTYKLEVLFPPDILEVQNITIIEGKSVEIKAEVVRGSPQETYFRWTRIKDNLYLNNETISIISVRRDDESVYSLSVNNTMKPTCGKEAYGYRNKIMHLSVLYPPEGMKVACLTDSSLNETIVDVFNITEGSNLTLACSAIGNPSPTSYFWSGKMYVSQANLTFYVTRNHSGDYNCTASNLMKEIPGTTTTGTVSKKYSMKVLYAPEVKKMQNITAIEGDHFKFDCPVTFGNPSETTFRWSRVSDNSVWNSQTLSISNITRYDGKTYTCQVNNTLHPTYGIETIGAHSQNVNIEILYKANITGFTIGGHNTNTNVTVNESDTVTFKCSVDSNPGSFMKITLDEKPLEEMNGTKELKHLIDKTQCTDWGTYYCHAHNQYNSQHNIPRTYITMYVNCAPRKLATIYPTNNVTNVTSGQQVTKTLTFKALAYPTPSSHWERNINYSWIEISHSLSNKIVISSSAQDLQYNLTVLDISESDYGQYRLILENSFGQHIQVFNLIPNAAPVMEPENSSIVGPAAGGTIGGVFAIALIALALLFVRKRRMEKMSQENKQSHEYQNMSFKKDVKQQKRLPPLPNEDLLEIHDRQIKQVTETHPNKNKTEFKMHQKSSEVKQRPKYENMNLTQDAKQNTRFDPDRIEDVGQMLHNHKGDVSEDYTDTKKRKSKMQQKPTEVKHHPEYENMNLTEDAKHRKRLPPIPTDDAYEVPDQQNQLYDAKDAEDHQTLELLEIINKISLSDLLSYVTSKTSEDYVHEYTRFPLGLIDSISYNFARKPQNAPLNRYQGIYPYDHSRVVIPSEPDFFINANYIDGHSKKKAYIASLGPTVRHTLGFQTFWKMVWHEKSDVIVMLTNLQEPSGMKCEKYWADYGTTREVGDFTIQSVTEEIAAEYTVRTFNVSKKGESRSVTQLHYTAWPDKKVPEDVTSLIEFWQRVKAAPTRSHGPLVVHCSAGIGRTGTYIALDRLFEEGKTTDSVNVFDCVMSMRQQRVNMVQTQDQYVYLHQALVYCLVFDTEPVTAENIEEYVKTTSHNVYMKLFEQLKQSVEVESTYETEARTRNCDDDARNRTQADIPGDAHRIRLFLDKGSDESDYINAVYLNSFKRLGYFIIAQSPLPNTLDDFVSMLYQENCCCIVSLDDYQQKGTNNAAYLPAENQHATYGTCTISSTTLDSKPAYYVRKLKIGHSSRYEKGIKVAHHFEYTGWKHDERIPKDVNMFVEFVQEVEEYATQLADEHSHVLVHCLTGSGRSGLFCAVSNLIQKMGQDRQVSVVNTLRQVRARRKTAIRNTEQLKFCYQAVYAYVKNSQV